MITRQTVGQYYPVKPLGDIVDFLDSQRRPVTEADRKAGPFPYYGANGIQGHIDSYLFDEPLVLLAEDGGHFEEPNRGIAYRISGKSWVNNHAHVIRPKAALDIAFLCRVLENYDVRPYISGTTRSKLTKGQAERIGIPVPPLVEQRRIAAILDQADELRRKRQRTCDLREALADAIFIELFGDPDLNPSKWAVKELGMIADFYGGTTLPDGISFQGQPKGALLVKVSDMNIPGNEYHLHTSMLWSDVPGARAATCPAGTVLIPKRGGAIGTNKKRLSVRTCMLDPNMMGIRGKTGVLETTFLMHWFLRFDLNKLTNGSSVPQLNKKDLHPLKLFVPPLNLQEAFADRIAEILEIRRVQQAHQFKLDALFASLQHRAFSGELTSKQAERELAMVG